MPPGQALAVDALTRLRASPLEFTGLLLLAAYAVIGAATLTGSHVWGDDWAQYVLHARNIVTGAAYGDTGYVFNPDAPYVGPPAYPPGLPLLIAPVIAVLGVDVVALKAVCFLCFLVMLPIAYGALARAFDRPAAFAAIALFALHEHVWALRQQINSEAPYILFSMLVLWHASRNRTDPAARGAPADGAIAGALVYAAIACRSIGVALVPALLLYAWAHRNRPSWYVAFLGSLVVPFVLQRSLLVAPATYSGELIVPGLQLIVSNLTLYWSAARDFVPMPAGFLSHIALGAVVAAACAGAWCVTASCVASAGGRSFRSRAACVPLPVWYLLAYMSALALASIGPGQRYLLPVVPIVVALAAVGAGRLARRASRPRAVAFALASCVAAYYVYLHGSARVWREDELATCAQCRDLYAFVQAYTPPDSVIAFAKPRALALYAGRPAWIWNPDYKAEDFRAKLERSGASFLITVPPQTLLHERYPAYLGDRMQDELGTTVFRNAMFRVIALRD